MASTDDKPMTSYTVSVDLEFFKLMNCRVACMRNLLGTSMKFFDKLGVFVKSSGGPKIYSMIACVSVCVERNKNF